MASASIPGSNDFIPSFKAFSILIDPTTLSSVEPKGSSTTRMFLVSTSYPSDLHESQSESLSSGSQLKAQPLITFIGGKRSAKALTAVVFPVPLSPLIKTPPILGFIAFSIRDFLTSSWPTIAVNGKIRFFNSLTFY